MADTVVAYIARHGTTELNQEDRYRGQADVPLDAKGREDAKQLARFMEDKPIGHAWTSDLSRAKETANEVLRFRGIRAIPLESLRPLDAGRFAGQKKEDLRDSMRQYHENTSERIPGGESIDDMHDRVRAPLFKGFRIGLRSGRPSFFSSHSSVIHSLGYLLHGDHTAALVEPGGVVEVLFDGNKFIAKPIFKPKQESKESAYAS